MISYLVATIPWTIGCLALSPPNPRAIRYRKYLAALFFGTLVPLVYYFIQHKVHKVAGGKPRFVANVGTCSTYLSLTATQHTQPMLSSNGRSSCLMLALTLSLHWILKVSSWLSGMFKASAKGMCNGSQSNLGHQDIESKSNFLATILKVCVLQKVSDGGRRCFRKGVSLTLILGDEY